MLKDIQSLQKQVQPILKEAGVASSFVFGSDARGEATQTSDVDLLVEFMPNDKSLFDLIRLKHRLEDTLGVSVDINTSAAVHPSLRTFIDRDKVRIL